MWGKMKKKFFGRGKNFILKDALNKKFCHFLAYFYS